MEVMETPIEDLVVLKPKVYGDDRGWFMESFSKQTLENRKLWYDFCQDNHSYSKFKGTLRGLHLQKAPYAQTKLIRCTQGEILDVAVDLRQGSPTYLSWYAVKLSKENKYQLLVPKGFAHGFLTLTDDVEVQYKVDAYYDKDSDRSIFWGDSTINIDWNIDNPILSDKDKNAPELNDLDVNFKYEKR